MTNSEKLTLTFVGYDDFSNPTYKTKEGTLLKDINDNIELPYLHTVSGNDIDGEPMTAICNIEKYKNRIVVILGRENEPTKDEKFRYMMLSRLKQDCEYYLGNGNRSTKYLWAGSEKDQIQEMKDRYNTFSADKKPEWLTWDDILRYESLMCNVSEQAKEGL